MIGNFSIFFRAFLLWLFLVGLIFFTVGCSSNSGQLSVKDVPPSYFAHILGPGETLGQLSTWYTGSESHWKDIYIRASDGDRHKLRVGGTILIPGKLLIRTDKPSKEFFKKIKKKVAPAAAVEPESLMNVQIAEPPDQKDLSSEDSTQKEKLEDEFLDQIIDSTKLSATDNETTAPELNKN